ncbi:PTS sugar transporter [Alkalibaculum sp. M08DMB]|uniref:PTS sugar transporter n=1 Tax=Alkalibaculum sporogenes TaxID=2655001 RepID=A0A6A7KAJ0_9FIRM|nr:PTS fructose transporter subunit IIC [Alkalibaculum sporogenes]MPW26520.1 PTS sugar transporter [Alkalibaculum sporogenes]
MDNLKIFGRDIKQALLTGVSYMLAFVVPGGILIALGFAFGGIYVYEDTSFAASLFSWGKIAFSLMVPIMAGYIAFSLADRPGIAPGIIAGMIAESQGSGFIGGMIGGILAGYIVLSIKKVKIPSVLQSLMPVLIIPLFGTIFIGVIMTYIIGVPVTWLNTTMTSVLTNLSGGSLIIFGLIQGAMLAIDMGGPLNKAAYFVAIGMATSGNDWAPMSANFIASMSPPMGIAIAMLISKNKFTTLERKGVGNCIVGGLAMITEFAIPYAVSDPFRVIPSLMVGSAIGAALSYAANLTLQAPHGGVFVILLANKPIVWLGVLAIASLITAGMLILLKPKVVENEIEIEA